MAGGASDSLFCDDLLFLGNISASILVAAVTPRIRLKAPSFALLKTRALKALSTAPESALDPLPVPRKARQSHGRGSRCRSRIFRLRNADHRIRIRPRR